MLLKYTRRLPYRCFSTLLPGHQEQNKKNLLSAKKLLEQQEFYGLPVGAPKAKNEEQVLVQINKYYRNTADLLQFYQLNRQAFGPESYHMYFYKLYGVCKSVGDNKAKIISDPSFVLALNDALRLIKEGELKEDAFFLFLERILVFLTEIPKVVKKQLAIELEAILENQSEVSQSSIIRAVYALTEFQKIGLSVNQAQKLMKDVYEKLHDLENITADQIFKLVHSFKLYQIDEQLLKQLEAAILAKIDLINVRALSYFLFQYNRIQNGSELLLSMILFKLSVDASKLPYLQLKQCASLCVASSYLCKLGVISLGFVKEILSKIFIKAHLIEPTHISDLLAVVEDHCIDISAYFELLGAAVLRHQENISFSELGDLCFRLFNRRLNSAALCHYMVATIDLYFRNIESGFTVPPEGVLPKRERKLLLPDFTKLKTDLREVLQIEGQEEAQMKDIQSSKEVVTVIKLMWCYVAGLERHTQELKEYVKVFNRRFSKKYSAIDSKTLNLLYQINSILRYNFNQSYKLNAPQFSEVIPYTSRVPEQLAFMREFNLFKNEHAFAFRSTKASRINNYQFMGETKLGQLIYIMQEAGISDAKQLLFDEIRRQHFERLKETEILELNMKEWRENKENYFFEKVMGLREMKEI